MVVCFRMSTTIEEKSWSKVKSYLPFLQLIPFIRMVAVCNNLAFSKMDRSSDIDLFIVAKTGRLFMVRTLVTLLLHVFGVRRHGKKIRGRFCLSFFVDESALNMSGLAIKNDIYLAYWLKSMKPVIDFGVSRKIIKKNSWAMPFFFRRSDFKIDRKKVFRTSLLMAFVRGIMQFFLGGKFGDYFESKLRFWQLKRAKVKANKLSQNSGVFISEHILKFHNVDRRRYYRAEWQKKYGRSSKITDKKFLKLIG